MTEEINERNLIEDLRKEHQLVRTRLLRLELFMSSDDYFGLGFAESTAIDKQRSGMRQYADALAWRIRILCVKSRREAEDQDDDDEEDEDEGFQL